MTKPAAAELRLSHPILDGPAAPPQGAPLHPGARRYAELHAQSAFSFLAGASLPEALAATAAERGLDAVALVDRGGVYGAPRFHQAAKKLGLRALVGADLGVAIEAAMPANGAGRLGPEAGEPEPDGPRLVLLAENRQGYQNLCRLITCVKLRAAKGGGAAALTEVEAFASGLIALAGAEWRHHPAALDRLAGIFGSQGSFPRGPGRLYAEVQRHYRREQTAAHRAWLAAAARH
ncbi:MAG: PHP domain-containing protein, partial [Terriglobales bacterium]